jgi:hypothetical protein
MPFKANAARRHHIPEQKRKVTNWATYDASLHQRGSSTVWLTDEALTAWQAVPRTTRGGILHDHCADPGAPQAYEPPKASYPWNEPSPPGGPEDIGPAYHRV